MYKFLNTLNNHTELGQNFLVNDEVIKRIIQVSCINNDDVIYEVGTGKGALTNELCRISKFVYSFELDSDLYNYCKRKLLYKNLKLLNLDGFRENSNIPFDIFISSLPYYESRNALTWLCQRNFKKSILLLQREFVEKLISTPGNKNYRAISIISQYRFSINILLHVQSSCFSPPPKVDSVLIELYPKTSPLSKKAINDIQFLLSFRKKNISFIINYFKKNHKRDFDEFDHERYGNNKLANLSPDQILYLSAYLNNDRE